MKTQFRTLIAIVFVMVSANIIAAERITYKWTDDKGEIHYTERAPKGREYTQIRTYVDEKNANTNRSPIVTNQNKNTAKTDSYGTWRNENCTIANQNLDILKNAGRISTADGDGGKRLMTDQEKQTKVSQMEAQRDKYCNQSEQK